MGSVLGRLVTYGKAYSSRSEVRLIVDGTGDECGNSTHKRRRTYTAEEDVERCVLAEFAKAKHVTWKAMDVRVVVNPSYAARGEYLVQVYEDVSGYRLVEWPDTGRRGFAIKTLGGATREHIAGRDTPEGVRWEYFSVRFGVVTCSSPEAAFEKWKAQQSG